MKASIGNACRAIVVFFLEKAWPVLQPYASLAWEGLRAIGSRLRLIILGWVMYPVERWGRRMAIVGYVAMLAVFIAVLITDHLGIGHHPAPKTGKPAALATKQAVQLGKGVWIVELDKAKDGDMTQVADRAHDFGLNHLIVKTDHDGHHYEGCSVNKLTELVATCATFGIDVYGYGRCFGRHPEAEADCAIAALQVPGIMGYVFDVEGTYEKPGMDKAMETTLATTREWLTANGRKQLLGYSSFALIGNSHESMPWEAMNKYCDVAMPQMYFGTSYRHYHISKGEYLSRVLADWAPRLGLPVIVPTVQSYDLSRQDLEWFLARIDTSRGMNIFRWGDVMPGNVWTLVRDFKCGPAQVHDTTPAKTAEKSAAPSKPKEQAKNKLAVGSGKLKPAPKMDPPDVEEPSQPIKAKAEGPLSGLLLIIDAGHGGVVKRTTYGIDSGCTWGFQGQECLEASYTSRMAKELADEVENLGADVAFTRWTAMMYKQLPANEVLPAPSTPLKPDGKVLIGGDRGLVERLNIANALYQSYHAQYRQVVFVSIHVDSMGPGKTGKAVDWKGQHVAYQKGDKNHALADSVTAAIVRNHLGRALNGEAKAAEDPRSLQVLRGNQIPNRFLFESGIPGDGSVEKPGSPNDSYRLRNGGSRKRMLHKVLVEPLVAFMNPPKNDR